MVSDPLSLSATELAAALRAREVSAVQLADAARQRATDVDGDVHAILANTGGMAR